jgi:hypothetical protein
MLKFRIFLTNCNPFKEIYINSLLVGHHKLNYLIRLKYLMESIMQLELEAQVITVRTNLLQGVLTVKTFEGNDCYLQMLDFIKEVYNNTEEFIQATIIIK